MSLIDELIAARKASGLSQAKLAEMSGYQQAALGRIEAKRISPTIATMERYFDSLGMEMHAISKQSLGTVSVAPYSDAYRDDLLFVVLSAKNALGRVPSLNPDLLDIESEYFGKGGGFFLALSEGGRVLGGLGYVPVSEEEARLHRFYVRPDLKGKGIGTKLLSSAEKEIREKGFARVSVHIGEGPYRLARKFYAEKGFVDAENSIMEKRL